MKIGIIKDRLVESRFSVNDINIIVSIIEPFLSDERVDERRKLIDYANKLFSEKYPEEIFFDERISPKIYIDMNDFMHKKNLSYSDMRRYVKWVIEFCEDITRRKPLIYDLYKESLYSIYLKRDKDEEVMKAKANIKRKKIFIIK